MKFLFPLLLAAFVLMNAVDAQKPKASVMPPEKFVNVVDHMLHSVCAIVASQGEDDIGIPIGSGFFINNEDYFVTNAHVARDFTKLASQGLSVGLYFPMFTPSPASTIAGMAAADVSWISIDDNSDMAVGHAVRVRGGKHSFVHMLLDQRLPPGTAVAMTGFPLKERYPITVTASVASQLEMSTYFFIDHAIFRGFSGSPVYLKSTGDVVGIAVRSFNAPVETQQGPSETVFAPALGHVLQLDLLRGMLTDNKITYNEPESKKEK